MASCWRRWYRRIHWHVVRKWKNFDSDAGEVDLLRPSRGFSRVYETIVRAKRAREMAHAVRIGPRSIPIISVGNFTFGATGKTPFVMFLTQLISLELKTDTTSSCSPTGKERVPMLLTRGYGDDESKMFRSSFPHCLCAIGVDRVQIGRQTIEQHRDRIACILLDDGLQQWRIQRDLEIVMVDGLHPFGNGKMIPHGSLRENPVVALQRADVIVVHHANLMPSKARLNKLIQKLEQLTKDSARNPLITTSMVRVTRLRSIFPGVNPSELQLVEQLSSLPKDCAVLVFCGVGNPESVELVVSKLFAWNHLEMECFPDHHRFSKGDLLEIRQQAQRLAKRHHKVMVLTTEKDFFRSGELMQQVLRAMDVRIIETHLEMPDARHQRQLLRRVTQLMS